MRKNFKDLGHDPFCDTAEDLIQVSIQALYLLDNSTETSDFKGTVQG